MNPSKRELNRLARKQAADIVDAGDRTDSSAVAENISNQFGLVSSEWMTAETARYIDTINTIGMKG